VPGGGFIVCGETFSTDASGNAFVLLTDALGNTNWYREFGTAGYDIAYSAVPLQGGGFIVTGLSSGTAQFDYNAFLLRIDAAGDSLWCKTYSASGIELGVQVIATSDGGFLFSGKMLSYGSGSSDCWLVKTDASGDTLWTSVIGGNGWDEGMAVMENAGGYIVCGGSSSQGGAGNYDFMLLQTDASGQPTWAKVYGGTNPDASYRLLQTNSGGYIFSGFTESFSARGTDSANVFVICTDAFGDTLWTSVYGDSLKEECFGMMPSASGGYALAGYTGSYGDSLQMFLFQTDANGRMGCYEKRAHPQVNIPVFNYTRSPVVIGNGLNYLDTIARVSTILNASTNQLCAGPLTNQLIEEINTVKVYPVPAQNIVNVDAPANYKLITIYDVQGNLMYETKNNLSSEYQKIDTHNLADGIYLLKLIFESGEERNIKIVIAH
ncbi:MAG: T9SS type A sorting domain-containing protein, partial [Bacteroidia bacterium]